LECWNVDIETLRAVEDRKFGTEGLENWKANKLKTWKLCHFQ